jgi:hypothetical protein
LGDRYPLPELTVEFFFEKHLNSWWGEAGLFSNVSSSCSIWKMGDFKESGEIAPSLKASTADF